MKLSLFHAPYIDENGLDRMRLSAVLTGADIENADDPIVTTLKAALVKCAEETTLLVVSEDIEVEWLR